MVMIAYNHITVDAKVLQIKDKDGKTNNELETQEKLYYVHFLNFEKRMDKWLPQSLIKKNFGKSQNGIIDGVSNIILIIIHFNLDKYY